MQNFMINPHYINKNIRVLERIKTKAAPPVSKSLEKSDIKNNLTAGCYNAQKGDKKHTKIFKSSYINF